MGEQPCRVVGHQLRGLHLREDRHPCVPRWMVGVEGTEKETETECPDLRTAQDMTGTRTMRTQSPEPYQKSFAFLKG